jgi:hypothetical protein
MRWPRIRFSRRKVRDPRLRPGSFVVDAEFHRTEELRPEMLGPTQEDVPHPERVEDPWRPARTLGPIHWPGHN